MRTTLIGSDGAVAVIATYGSAGALILWMIESPGGTLISGIAIFVLMILHLWLRAETQEKRFWGNLNEPHFVVDWGPYGKSIYKKLPEYLSNRYTAAPAREVESMRTQICEMLEESENSLFLSTDKPLLVHTIYFGVGEHFPEQGKPKQYLKRLEATMEKELTNWHKPLYDGGKEVEPGWYKKTYIDTHANGSVG